MNADVGPMWGSRLSFSHSKSLPLIIVSAATEDERVHFISSLQGTDWTILLQ